jgi:hypothetical protein
LTENCLGRRKRENLLRYGQWGVSFIVIIPGNTSGTRILILILDSTIAF